MDTTSELSSHTKELLAALSAMRKTSTETPEESFNTIGVSDLTIGIEFIYEKIRNAVDYHEEHLWLKNAILRVLRRRFEQMLAREPIGRDLIEELIRGRYLENHVWLESKAFAVDETIAKYRRVFEILEESSGFPERVIGASETWLLGLAAVEIEELFHTTEEDRLFISYFWKSIKERLVVDPGLLSPEFDQQLYLSVFRNFLQADAAMEHYELFRARFPQWFTAPHEAEREIAQTLPNIKAEAERTLRFPLRKQLDSMMKRRSLFILLLKDLVDGKKDGVEAILNDPEALEAELHALYTKRYLEGRARLQTAAIRAIIFLIITKMSLLFATEIPFQRWHEGVLNLGVLAINTIMPPFLLIASSFAIKMPGEEQNFLRMVSEFVRLVKTNDSSLALDYLRAPRRRPLSTRIALGTLIALNIALTAWIFSRIFITFRYNIVDGIILVLFLSLVSFFASRLRKTANEFAAVEQRDHILVTFVQLLLMPIVEIGKFLSDGLSSLNLPAFIFDFLIETPVKSLTVILEEWFAFMRERQQKL
jgi:hypothetical protein